MKKPEIVNKEQLHKLFLSGKPLQEIAEHFGSTYGSIRTMIHNERQRSPLDWPHRYQSRYVPATLPLMMHLYECEDCFITFAVEDYDGVDHSATVCPVCGCGEMVNDKAYGKFAPTSEAVTRYGT